MDESLKSAGAEIVRPKVIAPEMGASRHAKKSVIDCLAGMEWPQAIFYRLQREKIARMEDFVGKDPRKILGVYYNDTREALSNWLEGFCLTIKDRFPSPASDEATQPAPRRNMWDRLRSLHK